MYGAIIGDICGSKYEGARNIYMNKYVELFPVGCCFTDDTAMTIAVADALMRPAYNDDNIKKNIVDAMVLWARKYPGAGYGGGFRVWFNSAEQRPYNSFGNGSAMRVSPCALYAKSLDEALHLAKLSAEVTHNHPEGIKGAQAIAACIYMAKDGKSKDEIRDYVIKNFYNLDRSIDQISEEGTWGCTCMVTVPVAIQAFLESTDFEDAIRNAISVGGDTDTNAAMAGSIAWSFYKRHNGDALTTDMNCMIEKVKDIIPREMLKVIKSFERIVSR